MKQTLYVTDPCAFYEVLRDDTLETTNITLINDNIVQISYNKKDYYVEDPNNVNVFVAAFTTANAGMRLYDMLDRLSEAVVYYDIDSVSYIDYGNRVGVETGCMLGEWSDELCKDTYINDWISTGPKSYAFEIDKDQGTCKIKVSPGTVKMPRN